jgi:hypothetical protein
MKKRASTLPADGRSETVCVKTTDVETPVTRVYVKTADPVDDLGDIPPELDRRRS